ncbi:hypothetical protein [Kitasatospora sp. NPDC088548]|uniref:hypothetical protein n=1 Tax=Kitasatospora sp. NPDC088548 TaxID=3364075 RepID=UPI003813CBE9
MDHQHPGDQHERPLSPIGGEPADNDRTLWNATVAALAAVGIEVVQAGDGRSGAVLQLGPRGLAVAVAWQPTEQHSLPGGVLAVNVCRTRDGAPSARRVNNLILQGFLADAGLRTTFADGHLLVVDPDLQLPEAPARPAAPAARPAPAVQGRPPQRRKRRTGWFRLTGSRRT